MMALGASECENAFRLAKLDQFEQHKWSLYQDLIRRSTDYRPDNTPPNFPRSAIKNFPKGRKLETEKITNYDFPSNVTSWAPRVHKKNLISPTMTISEIEQANILELSDVVLWSSNLKKTPFSAFARLAITNDFNLVAVIFHDSSSPVVTSGSSFNERVLSAKLLSDLGIGPQFYGLYDTPQGKAYVVDLLPGEPYGIKSNYHPALQTLEDMLDIFSRLFEVGINYHLDFQLNFYKDHLLIIDPEGFHSGLRLGDPYSWVGSYGWPRMLAAEVVLASPKTAVDFLYLLSRRNPTIHGYLIYVLRADYQLKTNPGNQTLQKVMEYVNQH